MAPRSQHFTKAGVDVRPSYLRQGPVDCKVPTRPGSVKRPQLHLAATSGIGRLPHQMGRGGAAAPRSQWGHYTFPPGSANSSIFRQNLLHLLSGRGKAHSAYSLLISTVRVPCGSGIFSLSIDEAPAVVMPCLYATMTTRLQACRRAFAFLP